MRRAGRRGDAGRSGFTLLEVLIAMALSAVIMVALFAVFNAVADVAAGVKSHEAEGYGQRALESILFDDLRSVYRGSGANYKFTGNSGAFLGSDGEFLSFCTTATLGASGDGPSFSLRRVEYLLDGNSREKTLIRREKSYCGVKGDWEWVEVPILKGIADLEAEYLDPMDDSYVTEWVGMTRFPRAVLLHVTYVNGREYTFETGLSLMSAQEIEP